MSESKERLTESISALVDGEASDMELHRILKDVGAEQHREYSLLDDHSSGGKWSRYNLISNSLAETPMGFADISTAVCKAVDREETYRTGRTGAVLNSLSFGSLGRFAIAASVAMVAILGVQQFNTVDPVQVNSFHVAEMGVEDIEQVKGPAIQFPADFQPRVQARAVNAGGTIKTSQHPVLVRLADPDRDLFRDRQVRSFLSEVLEIHSSHESESGIQGMLPFARYLDAGEGVGAE